MIRKCHQPLMAFFISLSTQHSQRCYTTDDETIDLQPTAATYYQNRWAIRLQQGYRQLLSRDNCLTEENTDMVKDKLSPAPI